MQVPVHSSLFFLESEVPWRRNQRQNRFPRGTTLDFWKLKRWKKNTRLLSCFVDANSDETQQRRTFSEMPGVVLYNRTVKSELRFFKYEEEFPDSPENATRVRQVIYYVYAKLMTQKEQEGACLMSNAVLREH